MNGEEASGAKLLRKVKPELIAALCGDADFVLQHCHSLSLLSQREYDRVKSTDVPSDKVRDILDCMMAKDSKDILSFIGLLKKSEMQETFPKLSFLKGLTLNPQQTTEETMLKRKETLTEEVPKKKCCKTTTTMVTEKQLMRVAKEIGKDWKEVGRLVLGIPTRKLEEIEEDNPRSHRERVFNMLNCWRMREREEATTNRLHTLLTQEDGAVDPGSIDFLLDES